MSRSADDSSSLERAIAEQLDRLLQDSTAEFFDTKGPRGTQENPFEFSELLEQLSKLKSKFSEIIDLVLIFDCPVTLTGDVIVIDNDATIGTLVEHFGLSYAGKLMAVMFKPLDLDLKLKPSHKGKTMVLSEAVYSSLKEQLHSGPLAPKIIDLNKET